MTFIQFFKLFFGFSKNELQESNQQSSLDIANAQPTTEVYPSVTDDFAYLSDKLQSEEKLDFSTDEKKGASDEKSESTKELQDFVDEIDKEYSSEKQKRNDPPAVNVQNEVPETVKEQKRDVTSLLDNSPYMSLADSCCDLISELDKLKTEDNQELVTLVGSRIKEGLFLSGAQPIAEETAYDVIRHSAVGKSIVRKGTPIVSTIEPGVAIDDKVMIKAKVEI